jgi:thiamine biosynthesis protein ThiS
MRVRMNGEAREIPDGLTVSGLLAHMKIKPTRVAVELNDAVITRDRYDSQAIRGGDGIEIVAYVGGS